VLFDARTRMGLTQRAVEAATGVSNAYLSQLEGGKVRQPSPTILHKLCELYGLDYSVVLSSAGYPVPAGSGDQAHSRLGARIGPTTQEEEDAIADYVAFLRSKNQRKPRR
jgi:HTH-type transcriptional regulator, competence development regulator